MTKGSHPWPDDHQARLTEILERFGGQWQITRSTSPAAWVAIRRPSPTAQEVVVAHDLHQLTTKLEAEQ